MNVEDIKEFTEIVAYASISEAARRNNLSQQTLSRRIINLEKEVGHKLFDRSSALSLTPAGKVFLRYAYEILSLVQDMRSEMDEVASLAQGVVKVKRYPTDSFFKVLSCAVESLRETHPNVKFEFTSKNEDDRLLVREGVIDIGFVREVEYPDRTEVEGEGDLGRILLSSNSFPLVFGVPEGHPVLHMAEPTLADIASFRIAIPSFANKGALPNAVEELFRTKGLPLRIDMVYAHSMLEYYAAASPGSVYLFNEMYSVGSIASQRKQYMEVSPSDGPFTVTASAVYSLDSKNPALPLALQELKSADALLASQSFRKAE